MKKLIFNLFIITIFFSCNKSFQKHKVAKYYSESYALDYLEKLRTKRIDTIIVFSDEIFKSPGSASYIFFNENGDCFLKCFYNNSLSDKVIESKLIQLSDDGLFKYYQEHKTLMVESTLDYKDYGDHSAIASVKVVNGARDTLAYHLTIREYLSDTNHVRCVFFKKISEKAKANGYSKNVIYRTYWDYK